MLKNKKNNSISLKKAQEMSEKELEGKFITGVYTDRDKPSYMDNYKEVMKQANQ